MSIMGDRAVRIGLVQTTVSGDSSWNLTHSLTLVREAAEAGAAIICLPELFNSPYFPQYPGGDAAGCAEPLPGPSTDAFAPIAREYDVSIIVPLCERGSDGRFYNSAAVVTGSGPLLPPYRKVHIPHDPLFYEQDYFTPGSRYSVFDCGGLTVAVLICYDQWFPEAARAVTLMGADIIFYPTAIGWIRGMEEPCEGDWRDAWETVQRGHAIANGVHVAAVNRVGAEGDLIFWGSSFVADAFGGILARAGSTDEEVLVADIDPDMNTRVREGWGFLRNRRPDTYRLLSREG